MEKYNLLCTKLSSIVPQAADLCILTNNATSQEIEILINKFMEFCSDYAGVVMLNSDIIWEFLYGVTDIIQRNNYKFKFQDQIHYDEKTGFQTQIYEEVVRVPLDVLPSRK